MSSPVLESTSAPATAAEEAAPAVEQTISESGYQKIEFAHRDTPAAVADAPVQKAPPVQATPPVDGSQPEAPEEMSDEELEKVLRNPKAQARVDQLVNNRYGNKLQQERERARREAIEQQAVDSKTRADADAYYKKLSEDDDFFDARVAEHGRPKVLRWMADYEETVEALAKASPDRGPSIDVEQVRAEYGTAFNHTAINEFKDIAKATIPFWGDLPDDTRAHIEALAYDPDDRRPGGWLADALSALASGVAKHIDGIEKRHNAALENARQAGKNEAIASVDDRGPVVVMGSNGSPLDSLSWSEIEEKYAFGELNRDQFRDAARKRGKSLA